MKRKYQEQYDSEEEKAWRSEYMTRAHLQRSNPDPVARMISIMTSQEMLDWLRFRGTITAEEHAVDAKGWNCLESNIREQFKWHRLQGRLDRFPFLATLAQLWNLRMDVKHLEPPTSVVKVPE